MVYIGYNSNILVLLAMLISFEVELKFLAL